MKILIWLVQFAIAVWLMWWSFLILVQPINEYADASIFIPDCDRDGEDAALFSL